jgi:phytanoyl-CoA hydroxylase
VATLNVSLKEQLSKHGYLIAKGVLDDRLDLEPVRQEYKNVLDKLAAEWYFEQKINATYQEQPLGEQLCSILRDYPEAPYYENMDISLTKSTPDSIKQDSLMHTGPAIFGLLTNRRLLDVVEQIIGPEIYSNPVQHVRIKPPLKTVSDNLRKKSSGSGLVTGTQWHQDQGVITSDADNSDILTVWIPMTKATTANGCLVVAKKSHNDGLVLHCTKTETRPQWKQVEIPGEYITEEKITLEVEPGDVIFLTKLTKHSSLENNSEDIRWSFDLRYQPIGQPTGRSHFPGFVARSKKNPDSELKDHKVWVDLWQEAKHKLIEENKSEYFSRWDPEDIRCA